MSSDKQIIPMGRFGAPHGVKGWIKIISFSDPRENIFDYGPWYIQTNGQWKPFTFQDTAIWSNKLVVLPKNVNNRNDVEHLVNLEIGVPRECLDNLDDGYYWADLIGLEVETLEGLKLGTVASLMETGANDVLVCRSESKGEILIPFKEPEIVTEVDLDARKIIVDWEPL